MTDLLAAQRRPLSRGSSPSGYPAEPLVSFRINRHLSGWNLPPLMIRAFGAHCQELTYAVQQTNCVAHSITAAPNSGVPGRHVSRVRRSVGSGAEEPVVVIGVDVVRLHHPHEMHRISAAGKAAVSVVDVVANRLGAGEPFRADLDRTRAMLAL